VIKLLHGDKTGFVLVASPRVDTIDEARFFATRLEEKELSVAAIIINRATPDFGAPKGKRPKSAANALLYDNQAELHALSVAEHQDVAPLIADSGLAPTWVPLLPTDVHDLDGLDQIRSSLFQ
jgi:anion-transporting  ArsA/GET3 family ATPase